MIPGPLIPILEGSMKAIKITLAGRERYLAFTGEAMFKIGEEFGGTSELLKRTEANNRESLKTAAKAAEILAAFGELARRYMGYDPEPMLEAEAVVATITPAEIVSLKLAIASAITLGYGREVTDENEVVDLGLQESNAQKKRADAGALYPYGSGRGNISKRGAPHDSR